MNNDSHIPLTTLSANERGEYQRGIGLLAEGDARGLEVVLGVLQNSRPLYVPGEPGRTLPWAVEIINAYRNLGKVIRSVTLPISKREGFSELIDKIRRYDIIIEDDDKAPLQPLFDTLDRYEEINKILAEHEIQDPEQLKNVLNGNPDLEEAQCEVERFESEF